MSSSNSAWIFAISIWVASIDATSASRSVSSWSSSKTAFPWHRSSASRRYKARCALFPAGLRTTLCSVARRWRDVRFVRRVLTAHSTGYVPRVEQNPRSPIAAAAPHPQSPPWACQRLDSNVRSRHRRRCARQRRPRHRHRSPLDLRCRRCRRDHLGGLDVTRPSCWTFECCRARAFMTKEPPARSR